MNQQEEKYLFWLCSIHGLGLVSIRKMFRIFSSAEEIYHASEEKVYHVPDLGRREQEIVLEAKNKKGWEKEWEKMKEKGICFVSFFHEQYPDCLRNIYQPPKKLMVKGKLPSQDRIAIGVVGARNCTLYGRDMARMFGYRLAEQGVQIISGMALGVDGWSHQGALEAGGDTFAVLGSGVEVCYPARHRGLYESIQKHGGVFSEFPVYACAKPVFFPMRNRIISGLADGILVVEAREKSGSLITADAALEQGKDVFVIPGRIGDKLSVGCNRLIRQGAIPVLSPDDILEYYGVEKGKKGMVLEEKENTILQYMEAKPIHTDELIKTLKIPPTELYKTILQLKKRGLVVETSTGYFMKKI